MKFTLAGIYEIKNAVTGKSYIGSSYSVHSRMSFHLACLSLGCHENKELQDSVVRHGIESLHVRILEVVMKEDDLFPREAYWVGTRPPRKLYNAIRVNAVKKRKTGKYRTKRELQRIKFLENYLSNLK